MMASVDWLGIFLALSGAGIVLAVVLPRRLIPALVGWAGGLAGAILFGVGAFVLERSVDLRATLWTIAGLGTVTLHMDPLAGFFLLVTGLVFVPASIFGVRAIPRIAAEHWRSHAVMFFGLLLAIVWILLAADVFSFLVAWEIMSILCYLLVMIGDDDVRRRDVGYLMLAMGEAGALAAALGLLILATAAGSLDFARMQVAGMGLGSGARLAVFLLTFFGFGVKAGLVPVNSWLPKAYTAASTPFAPVLAGATLNLGLYGILRVNGDLLPTTATAPGLIALVVGTLSALVGILYATTDTDLKTLLANSSIENAGIITAGLGAGFVFAAAGQPVLAAVGFVVALYHLLNHSVYKTLLFIGAGVVDESAGTRDLDRLGGLIRVMPWTAGAFLVGALAIAALPPFNGFASEWLTLQTFLRSAELASVGVKMVFALCGAGLALTAALAVTCFVKVFAMGFLGTTRSPEAARARETTSSALVPLGMLAVLCLLLGVLPTYVLEIIDHAIHPLAHASGAAALVPPFFAGSAGHGALPPAFLQDFHALGAQVGQHVMPGPGLVMLHRGGTENPVVFAASPTYLVLVLAGFLGLTYLAMRVLATHRRTVTRRGAWDGGVYRLTPEMTYTATGFSNPVRVIFHAIFRPTIVEDTRETVAEHFRTAIRRDAVTVHIVERAVLIPGKTLLVRAARGLARLHHGRLNAYLAYALLTLVVVLVVGALL